MTAVNFSGVPVSSPIGWALRRLLGFIPRGTVVRVLQGPARGMKWVVGAQTHGMWLGSYERDKQLALCRELRAGQVFLDVGANVGFYTLIASRIVGSGRVLAFEPLPRNVEMLRRHVSLNRLSNVTVLAKALAEFTGTARFSTTSDCSTNRLDACGDIAVPVTTIDAALADGEIPRPDVVKIDVEGAELSLLRGSTNCLRSCRPLLFVALHSHSLYDALFRFLRDEQLSYTVTTLSGEPASEEVFVEEVILRPVAR